jgi:hypothetical protein
LSLIEYIKSLKARPAGQPAADTPQPPQTPKK